MQANRFGPSARRLRVGMGAGGAHGGQGPLLPALRVEVAGREPLPQRAAELGPLGVDDGVPGGVPVAALVAYACALRRGSVQARNAEPSTGITDSQSVDASGEILPHPRLTLFHQPQHRRHRTLLDQNKPPAACPCPVAIMPGT